MAADILAEILTTALIDQDSRRGKRGGCSIWFFIFLIAVLLFAAWVFYGPEGAQ